jgi:hypothetical protein
LREKKLYYVITFGKTTDAMQMEKICSEKNINGRLIPLPTQISASCGLAWRMSEEDYNKNAERLAALPVKFESFCKIYM